MTRNGEIHSVDTVVFTASRKLELVWIYNSKKSHRDFPTIYFISTQKILATVLYNLSCSTSALVPTML